MTPDFPSSFSVNFATDHSLPTSYHQAWRGRAAQALFNATPVVWMIAYTEGEEASVTHARHTCNLKLRDILLELIRRHPPLRTGRSILRGFHEDLATRKCLAVT